MSDFEIERSFLQSLNSLVLTEPLLHLVPIENINTSLDSYPELWLKFNVVRGNTTPATLGLQGQDNHNGFVQIDVNVPTGLGTGQVLKVADKIKKYYRAGLNVGPATVGSSSVSSGRFVGSWYRVSVTVFYYSRIARIA